MATTKTKRGQASKTKSKVKENKSKTEDIVPYRCFGCNRYDGVFGPVSGEYTHVCETCKGLPTDDDMDEPIGKHCDEYYANEGNYGEETLACPECRQERDVCYCPDNPLRKRRN